jgi:hypothetical protein
MNQQNPDSITGVPPEGEQTDVTAELAQLRADVDAATARAEAAETAAAEAEGKTPVYVVYDKTYQRYVSGTHETKDKATKAAKDAKIKAYRVDEVYR